MNESSMPEALLDQNSDPMFGHGQKMLKKIVASEERRASRLAQWTIAVWVTWLCILLLAAYSLVSGPLIQINLGPSGPLNAVVVPLPAPVVYTPGAAAPQYYAPSTVVSQYSTPAYTAPMFLPSTSTQATAPLTFTAVPAGDVTADPAPSAGPLSYIPDDAAPTYSPPPAVAPMPIPDTATESGPNAPAVPYPPGGVPQTYYAPPAPSPTYCPISEEPPEGAGVATVPIAQFGQSPTSSATSRDRPRAGPLGRQPGGSARLARHRNHPAGFGGDGTAIGHLDPDSPASASSNFNSSS